MSSLIIKKEIPLFECLANLYPNHTRTKLKQILKHGSVLVNGRVKTGYHEVLLPGDRIEIMDPKTAKRNTLRSGLPFPVVYEDDSLIVIEKPTGLLSVEAENDDTLTAYDLLNAYDQEQISKKAQNIFIVHRLDRDVSGLMIFAKTKSASEVLQKSWKQVTKKYYAIVEGVPRNPSGTLESYLIEDKFTRVYSSKTKQPASRLSITKYETVLTRNGLTLLDVLLVTGRKNQIRVHLSDMGHPIVGDLKYSSHYPAAPRLALHSYYLSFDHPATGEKKIFKSSLPPVLEKLLK